MSSYGTRSTAIERAKLLSFDVRIVKEKLAAKSLDMGNKKGKSEQSKENKVATEFGPERILPANESSCFSRHNFHGGEGVLYPSGSFL